MPNTRSYLSALSLLAVIVVVAGCSPGTPEEQVAKARSRYYAELTAFMVREEPVEVEPAMEDPAADPEAEPAATEGDPEVEDLLAVEPEVIQNLLLDILVRHDSARKLSGITIDIVQEDASGNSKNAWLFYADTSDLEKGPGKQVEYVVEDSDYVEGDRFYAEIRHPVPAGERSQYQEFAAGGSG